MILARWGVARGGPLAVGSAKFPLEDASAFGGAVVVGRRQGGLVERFGASVDGGYGGGGQQVGQFPDGALTAG